MAGHLPNTFYGKDQPQNPAEGDYWNNGAQIRIWVKGRGWVNVAGPAVETNA